MPFWDYIPVVLVCRYLQQRPEACDKLTECSQQHKYFFMRYGAEKEILEKSSVDKMNK